MLTVALLRRLQNGEDKYNVIDNTKNSLAHKIAAAATNADSSEDNNEKTL